MKRQTASLLKSRCYTLYEPSYMLFRSDHMSLTDAVSWHVFFLSVTFLAPPPPHSVSSYVSL